MRRPGSPRAVLAVVAVAIAPSALIQSLVIPVLGPLAARLDTDRTTVAWLLTAYLLSASVCTPLAGRLGDVLGKDRVLVASLLALAAGCAVSALAPTIGWVIAGRALQGASGGVLAVSFGIIRDALPPRAVPGAVGFASAWMAAGIGVGVVLAGPVVDTLGFSWLFWFPAIAGVLAAVLAAVVVPPSPTRGGRRPGPVSAVLLAAWLVLLLLGISRAPVLGWGSPAVLGLVSGAVVLAGLWVRVERTARVPLVDMDLMLTRPVWTANAVALLLGFGLYSTMAVVPQFVQTSPAAGYGFGAGVAESGVMMLPITVASFLAGTLTAPAARRLGGRTLTALGSLLGTAGTATLAVAHEEKWQVYVAAALFGGGVGIVMTCVANLVVAAVPAHQTGVAAGMNANIRTIGGAVGSAVLAGVVAGPVHAHDVPTESGYVAGFLVIAASLACGAALALLIPRPVSSRVPVRPDRPEPLLDAAVPE